MIDAARLPCAKEQCSRCRRAGRNDWPERVSWHADRTRRRRNTARVLLVAAVPFLIFAVLIGVLS